VIGKNMLSGFTGTGGPTGESDYGRPLNPCARDHVTGGSSSGSAVAVAAGEVDIAFAGDQGGSIRVPAAWCGVVGLKPTFGLVSHFGATFGYEPSLDHIGPIARRVEDVARALQAVAGYDPLDARHRRETPDSLDVLTGLAGGVEGLRIGLLEEGFAESDPAVTRVVMEAADALVSAGAASERISVPEHRTIRTALRALMPEGTRALVQSTLYGAFCATYYPTDAIAELAAFWRDGADRLNPRTLLSLLVAELSHRQYGGRVYAKAHNVRAGFVRAYDQALERVDVLLMPTTHTTAPRYEGPRTREQGLVHSLASAGHNPVSRNTQPFNYTGHPALALPCGSSRGLPVSMQLVGRRFEDALVLRVAYALEEGVDCGS
jgi:amidase